VTVPPAAAAAPPVPPLAPVIPARARSWLPVLGVAWLVTLFAVASISKESIDRLWGPIAFLVGTRYVPCLLGVVGLFVALGLAKFGHPAGVLITQQNVMSLSRFQMVLWTILIMGFFAAAVFARLAGGAGEPLNVAVAGELWGLIGISTAALVGTPFLLAARRDKQPVDKVAAAEGAAAQFDERAQDIAARSQGPLYVNPSAGDARFSDIFEGDEISNTQMIDLAKVQMLVFTVVSAVVWCIAAAKLVGGAAVLDAASAALPTLPTGLVTLLGVSNAGYLINKMVDHTPTK
jgi:hypothetical protein